MKMQIWKPTLCHTYYIHDNESLSTNYHFVRFLRWDTTDKVWWNSFLHNKINYSVITRVAICAIYMEHILARIFILPKITRFWLCFPVFILAEGNDRKVVWPIVCRHCAWSTNRGTLQGGFYRERSKWCKYSYILSVFVWLKKKSN